MAILHPLGTTIPRFTEEQMTEIVEWFDQNAKPLLIVDDSELINVIKVPQLQEFLALKKFHRRNFYYPTYSDIMIEVEKLKMETTRMITKEQFIFLLNLWVLEPDLKHQVLLAFKAFDTEKRDFLDIEELETIVTSYADIFNELESLELIRDANVRGDGNVFYADFVESLFSLAPQLYEIKAEYLYEDPDEDPSVPPLPPEPEPVPAPEPEPEALPPPPPPPPPKTNKKKK